MKTQTAKKPKRKFTVKPRSQWQQYKRRGDGLLKSEEEVAIALGEEPRTVRAWRVKGVIPSVVIGHRTVRFRLPDVLRALEKRVVKETA